MGYLKDILDTKDHWDLVERILGGKVVAGRAMKSPLRDDDHKPSFNVFKGDDGKVRWKDFAKEGGDIYSLAMHVYQCNFGDAIRKLAVLADIREGERPMPVPNIMVRAAKAFKAISRTRVTYGFRSFNEQDRQFWGRYGITQALMREYGAYACQYFAIVREDGSQMRFISSEEDPMYVYAFYERGKLYRPLHTDRKYRYMGNSSRDDVFGLDQLKADPKRFKHSLVIGGQKDALTAVANLHVNGIAFNSENMIIPENTMYEIMLTTQGQTFIMYDGDETGQKEMHKNLERFPTLKPIWINEYTNSAKDLSAIVETEQWKPLKAIYDHIHGAPNT